MVYRVLGSHAQGPGNSSTKEGGPQNKINTKLGVVAPACDPSTLGN